MYWCGKALCIDVDYFGALPKLALAYQSVQDGIPSIIFTGRHTPFDRNGIKFYQPDVEISKANEQVVLNSDAGLNLESLQSTDELMLSRRTVVLPVLAVLLNPHGQTAQVKALPDIITASEHIQDFFTEDSLAHIVKIKIEPSCLLNKIDMQEIMVNDSSEFDSLRMALLTGEVIHLKPSGEAPELRCLSDDNSSGRANELT